MLCFTSLHCQSLAMHVQHCTAMHSVALHGVAWILCGVRYKGHMLQAEPCRSQRKYYSVNPQKCLIFKQKPFENVCNALQCNSLLYTLLYCKSSPVFYTMATGFIILNVMLSILSKASYIKIIFGSKYVLQYLKINHRCYLVHDLRLNLSSTVIN